MRFHHKLIVGWDLLIKYQEEIWHLLVLMVGVRIMNILFNYFMISNVEIIKMTSVFLFPSLLSVSLILCDKGVNYLNLLEIILDLHDQIPLPFLLKCSCLHRAYSVLLFHTTNFIQDKFSIYGEGLSFARHFPWIGGYKTI